HRERAAGGRHRQRRALKIGEALERPHEIRGVADFTDRRVVAAMLALLTDAAADPPHRRMIEKKDFDDGLHEVRERVEAPHVCEFVKDERLELVYRHAGE